MALFSGDCHCHWIVAYAFFCCAPGRHERGGICPAHADASRVGGLQAIGSGAHPVICVAQADASHAVCFCDFYCASHGEMGVDQPNSHFAIPLFYDAEGFYAFGFGCAV